MTEGTNCGECELLRHRRGEEGLRCGKPYEFVLREHSVDRELDRRPVAVGRDAILDPPEVPSFSRADRFVSIRCPSEKALYVLVEQYRIFESEAEPISCIH